MLYLSETIRFHPRMSDSDKTDRDLDLEIIIIFIELIVAIYETR